MPLQIRTSAFGVSQRRLSSPGGSGMEGSCGGAQPLLSQCLENLRPLELCKVVLLVAGSFANSGAEATKGYLRATSSLGATASFRIL